MCSFLAFSVTADEAVFHAAVDRQLLHVMK
jgi:hypothetical protein